MLRVAQAIGSLNIGGSQIFVMNLYRNIDRNKVQFDFIVDHPNELYLANEIEKLGGRVFTICPFKGTNLFLYKKQWRELLVSHPEWTILHSHVRSTASLYIPVAHSLGIKTIIHSHSTAESRNPTALIKRLLEFPLRYQADYFFSCSDDAGRWLFGNKLVNQGRVVIVPNAIDALSFKFDAGIRESVRSELNIDDGAFVMGHVGRMVPVKNHEFILRVFQQVHARNGNSKLLLIGDGPDRKNLEKLSSELGINDSVIFAGLRGDINRCLQAMDLFIMPSLYEGFPVSLLEAQASGLPCVVSDVITMETDVCFEAIQRLSLQDELGMWVETCCRKEIHFREEAYKSVLESGFDVHVNSMKIQEYYLTICNEG